MKIQRPKSQKQGQRWISCFKEATICQKSQNTTAKKPEKMTKVNFLFERANILSEKPARKIG